jgi:hypothetical protein
MDIGFSSRLSQLGDLSAVLFLAYPDYAFPFADLNNIDRRTDVVC